MPRLYLSPSLQENNLYVIGGSEEEYMNLVADAMEPYLRSNGIVYTRNRPDMSLSEVINESNAAYYDLHLALHSNAAGAGNEGTVQGTDVYYYTLSTEGERAAEDLVISMKEIYPRPDLVRSVATTSLAEVRRTAAPSVLMEIAYHDNVEDATWIRDNVNGIARAIVQGLTAYFQIPFIEATPSRPGFVATDGGVLNVRERPTVLSAVVGVIPNGASVSVDGQYDEWYVVRYGDTVGYVYGRYIAL